MKRTRLIVAGALALFATACATPSPSYELCDGAGCGDNVQIEVTK